MAAEIKSRLNVQPELVAGGGGIFDVHVDDRLVFSKHQAGRFPEPGEVLTAIGPPKTG